MRQRIGIILFITGIMLLIKPSWDMDQMIQNLNILVENYWPVALVLFGGILLMPKKQRRARSK